MRQKHWVPTPEEIAAACAEIQAEWTDEEREKRWVGKGTEPFEVKQVKAHYHVSGSETRKERQGRQGW